MPIGPLVALDGSDVGSPELQTCKDALVELNHQQGLFY